MSEPNWMRADQVERFDSDVFVRAEKRPAIMTADGWRDVRRPDDIRHAAFGLGAPPSRLAKPMVDAAKAEREAEFAAAVESGKAIRARQAEELAYFWSGYVRSVRSRALLIAAAFALFVVGCLR